MSKAFIESKKKRLNEFLEHQTLVHEENKKRAQEHCDNAVTLADFAIQALKDYTARQIAAPDAAEDAHA